MAFDTNAPGAVDTMLAMPGNRFHAESAKQLLGLILGAAGVGAAARGAQGLGDLMSESSTPEPKLPLRRQVVTIPVPERKKGPYLKLAEQMLAIEKKADGPAPAPTTLTPPPDGLTRTMGKVLNYFGGLKAPDETNWGVKPEALWNYSAQNLAEIPAMMWAGIPAIAGAGYLGYKGVDKLLQPAKRMETDSDLERAKREYEAALAGKQASTQPLDRLAEKRALHPLIAQILSGYGLAALGAGGLGAMAGYNWQRGTAPDKTLEDALRQRRERMFASGPPPIIAIPVPAEQHQHKAANTAVAADTVLKNFEQKRVQQAQQTAQMLGLNQDKKPAAAPAKPVPPQLPSVVTPKAPGA